MISTARIPKLYNGDNLSAEEFMLRYEQMPDTRAELIEGIVYMSSPVGLEHFSPHNDVSTWLGTYKARTPGVDVGDNGTVMLDDQNNFQPDAFVYVLPQFGGRIEYTDGKYVSGSPELVVEVSVSTSSIDMNSKKRAYERNGVNEYIVWRVEDDEIDWFILKKKQFQLHSADQDGITRSTIFPGLWLDIPALINRDLGRVLDVVALGIMSPEHAAYVAKLSRN